MSPETKEAEEGLSVIIGVMERQRHTNKLKSIKILYFLALVYPYGWQVRVAKMFFTDSK